MKKPTNNVEFITQYMEFGSPLNQAFVHDCLSKFAKRIVDEEEEVLKSMEGSMIHGPSWVQCAKDYLKQSDEFYNREWEPPVKEALDENLGFRTHPRDWDTVELFNYLQDVGEIDIEDEFEYNAPDRCDMIGMIEDYVNSK